MIEQDKETLNFNERLSLQWRVVDGFRETSFKRWHSDI